MKRIDEKIDNYLTEARNFTDDQKREILSNAATILRQEIKYEPNLKWQLGPVADKVAAWAKTFGTGGKRATAKLTPVEADDDIIYVEFERREFINDHDEDVYVDTTDEVATALEKAGIKYKAKSPKEGWSLEIDGSKYKLKDVEKTVKQAARKYMEYISVFQ